MATTNYQIPEYTSTGSADLVGVSNAAFEKIDSALNAIQTALTALTGRVGTLENSSTDSGLTSRVSALEGKVSAMTPGTSDTALTVDGLKNAKVTSAGTIYYKKTA